MVSKFKKILSKILGWAKPYLTWRMALPLTLAWLASNGWAYVFVFLGAKLGISWMTVVGGTWVAILWMPWTLEKPLITIPLALLFYRLIYKEKFKKKEDNK